MHGATCKAAAWHDSSICFSVYYQVTVTCEVLDTRAHRLNSVPSATGSALVPEKSFLGQHRISIPAFVLFISCLSMESEYLHLCLWNSFYRSSMPSEYLPCLLQTFVVDKAGEVIYVHQPAKGSDVKEHVTKSLDALKSHNGSGSGGGKIDASQAGKNAPSAGSLEELANLPDDSNASYSGAETLK